jgi:hypothetical protein
METTKGVQMTETFDLEKSVSQATQSRMEDHLKSCQLSKKLEEEKGIRVRTHCSARHWGTTWYAVDDLTHYYRDDPKGQGQTEEGAILDLVDQLEGK